MITQIKQKTGDYCVVACIASALLDEGYDKLQELIVQKFPAELQFKKTGVPDGFLQMEKVFVSLNLAKSAAIERFSVAEAKNFLLENKANARWTFIGVGAHNNHLVRVAEIRDDGVEIMDPTDGRLHNWDWPKFEREYFSLVILNIY